MSVYSIKLKSVYLNDIDEVSVIMPDPPMRTNETPEEFYKSGKKFKVLWLLHGGRDTMRDWTIYSNIPRLAVEFGIMIVMPNGHDSDFVNHPESGDGYLFYDYFFKELMPCIHNWFPASDKKEDNYLAGASMGCAATWQYSILQPEKFGCAAPLCNQPLDYRYLEEYRNMNTTEFRKKATAENSDILAAYGAVGERIHTKELNAICKYDTVGEYLDSVENTLPRFEEAAAEHRLPDMWVPCGNEPRDRKLLMFKEYCESHGYDNMRFELFEGETHSFVFWEKAVRKFIEYLNIPKVDYFVGV